jgi:DNA-binding NarL/FixJ family response regulator
MKAKEPPKTAPPKRQVFILDDHPVTRSGVIRLLEIEADLACCGEAGSARQAMDLVQKCKPDLILVDLALPDSHGLEFIKDLRAIHPDMAVLVVSMHDETIYAERALAAGARGYLMKTEGGAKLVAAIRHVLEGKIYVSQDMAGKMLDAFSGHRRDTSVLGHLTDREFEVFGLLGQGMTNQEIGKQLHLSAKTVETHRLHIRDKLELKKGADVVKHAMRWASSKNLL